MELCHREKRWSVDVFDGRAPKWGDKDHIPPHLNHSDLIILDYHLDGSADIDSGGRARDIICELEKNNHFNIIVVHTNGYSHGGIELVFDEILAELLPIPVSHCFDVEKDIEEMFERWSDANSEFSDDYVFFEQKISFKELLNYTTKNEKELINLKNPNHCLHGFQAGLGKLTVETGINISQLIRLFFKQNLKFYSKKLKGKAANSVNWFWDGGTTNFIANGRVFVSVVKKNNGNPEEELFEPLRKALCQLKASPMHLLMAKIRHDMDERGLEQANQIISDRKAQIGWLYNLIQNSDLNTAEHDKIIDLHWEQLARAAKRELREFSRRLVSAVKTEPLFGGDSKSIVKYFFKECTQEPHITLGHVNALSCSQPVLEKHLTTGTILHIGSEYWVCLSPACDMVPKQRLSQWESRIGKEHLAFKAVKLSTDASLNAANGKATRNDFIYLLIDGIPKVFSLANGENNPEWEVFYAENHGVYDDTLSVNLVSIRR
ncbi:response regulator receiver domain [Shewanella algae]|uniref:response regulator receiver domain n=1 Tax=Shewanella algae TaxID=38313 RepID=UPI0021190466|nr:response regulator receiver domain [Shewanella algae]